MSRIKQKSFTVQKAINKLANAVEFQCLELLFITLKNL